MKQVIIVELRRAFESKTTKIVLIIGMLIAIFHVFHNLGSSVNVMKHMEQNSFKDMLYPIQIFDQWICGNTYNLEGFLYFMILPILAVLPFGSSFHSDLTGGFLTNIYARCKRSHYLIAKYIAVFIVSGTVFIIPLLLNLAICATVLPSLKPQNIIGTFVNTSVIWYRIYESYPYIYVLLFLIVDFIFAGLISCLALTVSFYTEKKIVVLITPFIIHIFIYSVCGMVGNPKFMNYSPTYFLLAGHGSTSGWIFILFGLAYFLIGGVWFYHKGMSADLF